MRNQLVYDLRQYETTLKMRRPEIAIYSDIIDAILKHGTKSQTKIQTSANLEYDRMLRLIKKMQKAGFLDEKLHVTEKGKSFRKDFEPARKIVLEIFHKILAKTIKRNHR